MPLLWLSLAGIVLAANLPLSTANWLLLAGLAIPLALLRPLGYQLVVDAPDILRRIVSTIPLRLIIFLLRSYSRLTRLRLPLPFYALLLAASLGALRYRAALPQLEDPTQLDYYNHPETLYLVEGNVIEPPDMRDRYTNLLLIKA